MVKLDVFSADNSENKWSYQLDQFVQENEQNLAALAWGLSQEWGETKNTLGIDLKPTPHFVCCSRESLEYLNQKVARKIQEILGILDGYNPEEEVAMIGIGDVQIKLIYFQPNPSPPLCFESLELTLDNLIQQLEIQMIKDLTE